jgi:predicted transcriptional regulator
MDESQNGVIALTADIVSAFVAQNNIAPEAVPELIRSTYSALTKLGAPEVVALPEKLTPAVPVKKSITPDHLISLEDGQKYKSLKRHLRTKYNMSPEDYRAKWGLPKDYPMVAPNYAASRSALAKSMGLGRGGAVKPATKPMKVAKARAPKAKTPA